MMQNIMEYAYLHQGPIAFRYPRGSFILDKEFNPCEIKLGKAQWLVKIVVKLLFRLWTRCGKSVASLKSLARNE